MRRMNIKKPLFMTAVFLAFVTVNHLPGLIGSTNTADAAGLVYVKTSQSGPVSRESVGSPPSGRSEALEGMYQYQYYPASDVYFDPARRLFFYEMEGRWMKSPDLPAHLRRPGDFIIVEMQTPNPFEFNSQVKQIDVVETERLSKESTGPPAWEPADSGPVYHYRYYPSADVYLDMDRELYFYQSKGSWVESPTLPEAIAIKLGPSAVLHMNTATPYVYHSEA